MSLHFLFLELLQLVQQLVLALAHHGETLAQVSHLFLRFRQLLRPSDPLARDIRISGTADLSPRRLAVSNASDKLFSSRISMM